MRSPAIPTTPLSISGIAGARAATKVSKPLADLFCLPFLFSTMIVKSLRIILIEFGSQKKVNISNIYDL